MGELITGIPGAEQGAPVAPVEAANVPIADGEFRGDPRRVPGHPANKAAEQLAVYGGHLEAQEAAGAVATESVVDRPDLITEVPK